MTKTSAHAEVFLFVALSSPVLYVVHYCPVVEVKKQMPVGSRVAYRHLPTDIEFSVYLQLIIVAYC